MSTAFPAVAWVATVLGLLAIIGVDLVVIGRRQQAVRPPGPPAGGQRR